MKIYTKSVAVSIENGINNDSEIGGGSFSSVAMLVDSPLSGKLEWAEFRLPWSRKAIENLAAEVARRDQYDNRVWLRAGSACKLVCGPIESVDAENGTIVVGQPCHHQFVKYPTCKSWEQPSWTTYTMCLVDGAYKSICDGSADVSICVDFDEDTLVESTLVQPKPEAYGWAEKAGLIKWSEYEARRVIKDFGSFSAFAENVLSVNPGRTIEDLLSGDLIRRLCEEKAAAPAAAEVSLVTA